MQVVRWPPETDFAAALADINYQLSTQYFLLNLLLVVSALVFGLGMLEGILRAGRTNGDTMKLQVREVAFFGIFLGFAVIIAELFFLALAGLLYLSAIKFAFLVTLAGSAALLLGRNARLASAMVSPAINLQAIATTAFVALLAWYQYSSASSLNIGDSTSFHAVYADVFLKHHGLLVDYHLIYPFHTLNFSLLYSLALALKHDLSFVQSVHALFATLTMFGIYMACLRFGNRLWLAVLLPFVFSWINVIKFLRYEAIVDFGGMFFVFAAFYLLLLWTEARRSNWLLVSSAIGFGIAMGTKYILCLCAAPITACILLAARKEAMKPLLVYAASAAVWGLWWYVRNLIMTGNPVHPFAPGIFGYYLWDAFDMQSQMGVLDTRFIPPTILGFLAAPFYAAQSKVMLEQEIFPVLLALYLTLPFIGFATKTARYIPLICFTHVFFWLMTTPEPRYLLPVTPLVFVFVAAVFNGAADKLGVIGLRWFGGLSALSRFLRGVLGVIAFTVAVLYVQQQFTNLLYSSIDPAQGRIRLLRYFPDYDLVEKANAEFGEHGRIFDFGYRNIRWYFKGTMLGTHYGEHGYYRVLGQAEEPGKSGYSAEKLEKVLLDKYAVEGFMIPNPPYLNYDQTEFDERFQLVYRNNSGSIYRIKDSGSAAQGHKVQ